MPTLEKVYKFFVQEPGEKTTTARLRTIVGDLFQSSDCLAHCVAEDVSMSAGIAKEFAKRFPQCVTSAGTSSRKQAKRSP